MILPAQTIRSLCRQSPALISPFFERGEFKGLSFGLSSAGYDIRVAEHIVLWYGSSGHGFRIASSIEHFDFPLDLLGRVTDKSTWARRGLAVQNTVIEPGWRGHLTLELTNHGQRDIFLTPGTPIAQILFERLESPTEQPYIGKYQDQAAGPQEAR